MMRKLLGTIGLFAMTIGTSALAAGTHLQANLDGIQEVPPNAGPAFGLGDFTLDPATNMITVDAGSTYQDLLGNSTAVTLNDAATGSTGPVILVLTLDTPGAATGTFSGSGTITAAQTADVLAGNSYVNIRSNVFPGGEIRGQLAVVPEPASTMLLAGAAAMMLRRRRR